MQSPENFVGPPPLASEPRKQSFLSQNISIYTVHKASPCANRTLDFKKNYTISIMYVYNISISKTIYICRSSHTHAPCIYLFKKLNHLINMVNKFH
jgi:hypothetical protein